MQFSGLYNFGAALACAAALTGAVQAAPVDAQAKYAVSLGGIGIANVTVDLTDTGKAYDLALKANVAGLGSLVASGTAKVTASGNSAGRVLASKKFDLETKANGEVFDVDVAFSGGDVSAFIVTPPLIDNYNRVPIERSHLSGVGDMLSAFVLKGKALDKSLCQRKMQVFTGVERFNIAMSFAGDDEATSARTGYQGPVVSCAVRYTPVSGHFTTSEITNYLAESDRILIWYAPLEKTGYYIPYRVLLTTSVGDLSMVLTGMKS